MEKTLYIYRASAGSGKTFTLAVEYMKLLIADPSAYRHILAVTFTNKATGEMKERIMSQLYGVAHALPSSDSYYEILRDTFPSLNEDKLRERARTALHLILHDYGHFRVQTIDAFFQNILRGLAKELELSNNMEIMIEGEELLKETVDRLIQRLTPASKEMQWLVEYIKEHLEEGKSWNVPIAIKDFANNILKEEYQERGDSLREKIDTSNGDILIEYRNALRAIEEETIESIKRSGERFFSIASQYGLGMEDFSGKSRGVWPLFEKFSNGDIPKLGSNTEKCMNNPSIVSKRIPETECIEIVRLIERVYGEYKNRLISCSLSLARFHQLRLLNSIAENLRIENIRENRFILAQTTYLLSRMIDNDTSFIFEKIGTEINHIFIDEFQDTSRLQWNCFKVLLNEVMSRGGFNLIVGDVKQSIYRWRNSDWNILNNIENRFHAGTIGDYATEHNKNKNGKKNSVNYRSERNIVDFNNALFRKATEIISTTYATDLKDRLNDLTKAYSDVEQSSVKSEKKGYAEIRMLKSETKKKEDMIDAARVELTHTLHRLIDEEGVLPSDITILIRNKKEASPIVEDFNREFPHLNIVSESAYKLSSSIALRILIAALRNISLPDDTLNAIELATYYQRHVKGCQIASQDLQTFKENYKNHLPCSYIEQRESLIDKPINEIIEQLIVHFNLSNIEGETPYIYSFIDYMAQYTEKGKCNINDFLDYWNDELCDKSIPTGNSDSVQIMTIHKAKGLEFHTVIIPFCFWKITKEFHSAWKEKLLWCTSEEEPYSMLPLIPIEYVSRMSESVYSQEYNHETLFELVDNLNLIYVACTRASKNLFILSNSTNSDMDTSNNLLGHIIEDLPLQGAYYDREEGVLTYGSIVSHENKATSEKEMENPYTRRPVIVEQPFITYENRLTSRQSHNLARFLANEISETEDTEYLDRGELLHEIMSKLITGEELEKELVKKEMEGIIATEKERNSIKKLITNAISHPQAQDWFSGRYTVLNECSIVNGNGQQKICRPDRVMIDGEKAIVVDFKFARPREIYIQQVSEYMNNLSLMGYKDVEGYIWYIYNNRIEPVKNSHL
ncbi:MAG: UvrD-helicase domain-containing protein [Bacteroidaceae bacterium]|nr:UvrD-helicase domain-containing protein [Bacteroidaceae bacterium]